MMYFGNIIKMKIELSTSVASVEDLTNRLIFHLKESKQYNDQLAGSIADHHFSHLDSIINAQIQLIDKFHHCLNKLEQNYLDPDHARKVIMAKQQFKVQLDRFYKYKSTAKNQEPSSSHHESKQSDGSDCEEQFQSNEFDVDLEFRISKQKSESLLNVQNKIITVNSIARQTQELTIKQGEHLDLVSDHLEASLENTQATNTNLKEASQYQKKNTNKYIFIGASILITVVIVIALGLILS